MAANLSSLPEFLSIQMRGFMSLGPPKASIWAVPCKAMLPTNEAAAYLRENESLRIWKVTDFPPWMYLMQVDSV